MKFSMEKFIRTLKDGSVYIFAFFIILMFVMTIYQSKLIYDFNKQYESIESEDNREKETDIKKDKNIKYVDILAVGDVMVHTPQLAAQRTAEGYDFTNNFTYVKDIISDSDISIANLETTLAGPDYKYDGYPRFNTPDVLVDALKEAGFNVINFCNNHILDMGKDALKRTISVLKEKELPYIGVRESTEDRRYIVLEKNDIKVGICGYTYQIPTGSRPTLNGNPIPEDMIELINTFNYYDLDNDLAKIGTVIDEMRIESDMIVFVIHWGNEYETVSNDYQKRIATYLSEKGVNVIFGSHPHVLQPFDTIGSTNVFYSMGNFISNQRYEAMDRRDTEDGIILKVRYKKDFDNKIISYEKTDYISTWVNKYYDDTLKKNVYEILPLNIMAQDKETKVIIDEMITTFKNEDRAQMSYTSTSNIIANSNIKNLNEIKIK